MCTLLQYFCDCELRHRVEAITAFSDEFVNQIQSNQRQRYNELMMAFTMSAAETARKTREFRSPPQEQVHPQYTPRQKKYNFLSIAQLVFGMNFYFFFFKCRSTCS